MCSGIFWITSARCPVSSSGRPGGGLVEEDEARLADDGAGDLDEAAVARAEAADLRLGRRLEPDELERGEHVGPPRRPRFAFECSWIIATFS